ncbi:MAG: DUF2948 family protein [Hyphomicrobium sp.]
MPDLKPEMKLVALDREDLVVLSAQLQDAVVRVSDMAFLKADRRFAAVINRFDWQTAETGARPRPAFSRHRAGLRFERVLSAQVSKIDLASKETVLSLLAVEFDMKDDPEGFITLHFSGGGAIRLHVECIEAELKDLGAAWATAAKPVHSESD